MTGTSRTPDECTLWSLSAAGRDLGTDAETLFEWLRRRRYVYRYTGLGNGRKLAYRHWVRAGLFENAQEVKITSLGMQHLAHEYPSQAACSRY